MMIFSMKLSALMIIFFCNQTVFGMILRDQFNKVKVIKNNILKIEKNSIEQDSDEQSMVIFFGLNNKIIAPEYIPQEIKQGIGVHVLGGKEWWHLSNIFEYKDSSGDKYDTSRSVCFNDISNQLAVISNKNDVQIFNLTDNKKVTSFQGNDIESVCFNHKGNQLAIVSRFNVRIFDLVIDNKLVFSLEHNNYALLAACFNRIGNQLALASGDQKVRIFNLANGKELFSFTHKCFVMSFCFNHDGNLLATASAREARIFDLANNKELFLFQHNNPVDSVCFNYDGHQLATGSKGVRIFDLADGKELFLFQHNKTVDSVCFSHDDNRLAMASSKKTQIFDPIDNKELFSFEQDYDIYSTGCFNYIGNRLVMASGGKALIFTRYTALVFKQILLKKIITLWLCVEKPSKKIVSVSLLFKALQSKFRLDLQELCDTWKTFSEFMQLAIWRSIEYKIKQYGK